MAATEPQPSFIERLFAEHRGALQTFFWRRIRCKAPMSQISRRRCTYGCGEYAIWRRSAIPSTTGNQQSGEGGRGCFNARIPDRYAQLRPTRR